MRVFMLVLLAAAAMGQERASSSLLARVREMLKGPELTGETLKELSSIGSMAGFLTVAEVWDIVGGLAGEFPQFVSAPRAFGLSVQKNAIREFRLGNLS